MHDILYKDCKVILKSGVLSDGYVCTTAERISYVGEERPSAAREISLGGKYLSPGFIDLHCHGGGGYDFMDASPEEMLEICKLHLAHGTTTLFATSLTSSDEDMAHMFSCYAETAEKFGNVPTNTLFGIHLEGPFLNMEQCGAQNGAYIVSPAEKNLESWFKNIKYVRRMTYAPELSGADKLRAYLKRYGIIGSLGHSSATFEETMNACDENNRILTHFYSGMNGVVRKNAYRVAGMVEAGYYNDDFLVEIIADGKHLPAELLKLIYKFKGPDKIALITDATRAAGISCGRSKIGSMKDGVDVIIEDGVAKLPDRKSFGGSISTMDRDVRVMKDLAGVPLAKAVKMASSTPARMMNLFDVGEIAVGKIADMVVFDENIIIEKCIKKGVTVYENQGL